MVEPSTESQPDPTTESVKGGEGGEPSKPPVPIVEEEQSTSPIEETIEISSTDSALQPPVEEICEPKSGESLETSSPDPNDDHQPVSKTCGLFDYHASQAASYFIYLFSLPGPFLSSTTVM